MSTLLLDKIINQHLGAYSKKCSNSSKKTKAASQGGGKKAGCSVLVTGWE